MRRCYNQVAPILRIAEFVFILCQSRKGGRISRFLLIPLSYDEEINEDVLLR